MRSKTLPRLALPALPALPFALAFALAPALLVAAPLATATALAAPPAVIASAPVFQDQDSPKGVHKDSYYGFSLKHPKKWSNIARKTNEQWLAAKYVSDKSYSYTDKDVGYTVNHTPELQVIVFPLEVTKKGGITEDEKEIDGEKVTTFKITSPYRNYDDFLTRTYTGGGYYLSDQEEDEIDDIKVTKYTYTVDKMARSGPQTIETWVYHTEDVDYAVQLVGLTKHWKKIAKIFKPARQTFEIIERTGSLAHSGETSDTAIFRRVDLSGATPKERKSKAVASESSIHEAAIAKLPPDGWESKKSKRTLVITSADKRYSKRVQSHVDNLFKWLDSEFGFLGTDAYMRAPVVRICATQDEAAAFTAGTSSGGYGGFWNISDELLTWDDTSGWTGYAIDNLNSQAYRYWMLEKNFELSTAMPDWIDLGLSAMIQNSRMDSRKIDWRFQNYTVERFRNAIRDGKATPVKEIFLRTTKEFRKSDKEGDPFAESAMLINYLASPEIRRHPLAKGLLKSYLENMISVVEGVEKDSDKALDAARKKATGDDGDKVYGAARKLIFASSEKKILQKTFDLTFGSWDESDWNKFQDAFYSAF
jgi:hypothetical protein